MLKKLIIFIILIIGLSSQLFAKKEKLYISVASSLYIVSKSLAIEWEKKNNIDLIIVTGPTSLISRQIYNGQNSDLIITANRDWLNWLDNKQLINIKNAEIVAKNSLVFSSGINQGFYIDVNSKSFKNDFLEQISSSMFPIPHPSTVPLGIYAKQALESMDLWDSLKNKFVFTASSQANLKFLSNGDSLVGISYKSDVISSSKILIVAEINESIFKYDKPTYWAAKITRNGNKKDFGFLKWLKSNEAQKIIKSFGFEPINQIEG